MSPLARLARLTLPIACALLLGACGGLRPARVPLETSLDRAGCAARADTLLVLLPGAYSHPDEFVREGFVRAVQARRLAVDVMRVDAHLGYYSKGSFIDRLRTDVMTPARAGGYRRVWVVGISVGGLGGMVYAEAHPGEIDGLVVLAPYLGDRLLSADIANAGGLARWPGPLGNPAGDDRSQRETRLWKWLQGYAASSPSAGRPPLYLGYGVDDRFAFSHRLLAAALPAGRVATTPGGHDWPEWVRLWEALLPTLPLPVCPP
ncbi:MAG: alpha/beta hydrolase [Comamonadaceae bacterium]|nr:MAG: alpha/beta hydrolase [Comamonadaceae bacterium]